MKIKFTIEKLPRPERVGDWHDKPIRWVARAAGEGGWTQKFSTKRDAMLWRKCVRASGTFNEAMAKFQAAS